MASFYSDNTEQDEFAPIYQDAVNEINGLLEQATLQANNSANSASKSDGSAVSAEESAKSASDSEANVQTIENTVTQMANQVSSDKSQTEVNVTQSTNLLAETTIQAQNAAGDAQVANIAAGDANASAAAAKVSETNAKASEVAALSSEVNANTSASNAAKSAVDSAASADEAKYNANQTFVSGGTFELTPASPYPDTVGVVRDTVWITRIDPFDDESASYTYTSGQLAGKIIKQGWHLFYDTPHNAWSIVPVSGTGILSVNGKVGVAITLDADDVGAVSKEAAGMTFKLNNQSVGYIGTSSSSSFDVGEVRLANYTHGQMIRMSADGNIRLLAQSGKVVETSNLCNFKGGIYASTTMNPSGDGSGKEVAGSFNHTNGYFSIMPYNRDTSESGYDRLNGSFMRTFVSSASGITTWNMASTGGNGSTTLNLNLNGAVYAKGFYDSGSSNRVYSPINQQPELPTNNINSNFDLFSMDGTVQRTFLVGSSSSIPQNAPSGAGAGVVTVDGSMMKYHSLNVTEGEWITYRSSGSWLPWSASGKNMFEALFPVGHILITTNTANPATYGYNGVWALVEDDVGIETTNTTDSQLGTVQGDNNPLVPLVAHTHGRGTMNITGGAATMNNAYNNTRMFSGGTGAFTVTTTGTQDSTSGHYPTSAVKNGGSLTFDASRNWTGRTTSEGSSNATLNVRGRNLKVLMWERVS